MAPTYLLIMGSRVRVPPRSPSKINYLSAKIDRCESRFLLRARSAHGVIAGGGTFDPIGNLGPIVPIIAIILVLIASESAGEHAYSLMLGLLIILASLGVGFAAGYVTRGNISSKRRAEYLRYEPYVSPSRRPAQPPMREAASGRAQTASIANADSRRTDITRSFHDVHIQPGMPGGANLHLVHPRPKEPDSRPARSPTIEESLEQLIARLQESTK
jgi:hypothetical protein